MKTTVVPVTLADFDPIHDALLHELNPSFTRDRWRRIFDWGWENPEDHVGFALVTEKGEQVGYVGTLYHDLTADNGVHRVCNLTSWIVKDGYRSSALALVMPVIRRREITVTNLTSLDTVNDMFRKLGFKTLESHTLVLLPWARSGSSTPGAALFRDPGALPSALPEKIRADVAALPACKHWVVELDGEFCHLAFTVGRRRRLRTLRIHHVGNPEIFVQAASSLRQWALRHERAPLLECDRRLLPADAESRLSGIRVLPLPVSRLIRSSVLEPSQVSNLYSELPLLNL